MCITFSVPQDSCDVLSYGANFFGNAFATVAAGTATATAAFFALNHFGYQAVTAQAISYIPVSLASFGLAPLAGAVGGGAFVLALILYVCSNRNRPAAP